MLTSFFRNLGGSVRQGIVTVCQIVGLGLIVLTAASILAPFLLGLALLAVAHRNSADFVHFVLASGR